VSATPSRLEISDFRRPAGPSVLISAGRPAHPWLFPPAGRPIRDYFRRPAGRRALRDTIEEYLASPPSLLPDDDDDDPARAGPPQPADGVPWRDAPPALHARALRAVAARLGRGAADLAPADVEQAQ
jgi:hypothetical protein